MILILIRRKISGTCLVLVTAGFAASTSLLELASLALEVGRLAHVRAGLGTRSTASLSEVLVDGTGLDGATKQHAAGSCFEKREGKRDSFKRWNSLEETTWSPESAQIYEICTELQIVYLELPPMEMLYTLRGLERELIEGEAASTVLGDARAGGFGEAQGAHGQLRNVEHAHVVGDVTADDSDLVFLALHVIGQLGDGHRSLLDGGHAKAVRNDLVEVRLRAARQDLVGLRQKLQVRVVALDIGALVRVDAAASLDIDTHL